MPHFKAVLENVSKKDMGITLSHEHICCYSDYIYGMAGKAYLDKERLVKTAVAYLKELKTKYSLSTFVDCTPVNIGRNVEILKQISEQSEVNIGCSTGFYYTNEPLFYNISSEQICKIIVSDAKRTNAGIIKCAVEERTVENSARMLTEGAR